MVSRDTILAILGGCVLVVLLIGPDLFLSLPRRVMVNQVIIEVTYDGQWQGAIVQQGSMESWSGTGYKGKSVQRPPSGEWIISFNAQKMDGSSKKLTVRITTLEGEVLKEASTTSPYGIAQLSVKIA